MDVYAKRIDPVSGAVTLQSRTVATTGIFIPHGYAYVDGVGLPPKQDIMLLRLNSPFKLDSTIQVAELPRAPVAVGQEGSLSSFRSGSATLPAGQIAILVGNVVNSTDCTGTRADEQFCVRSASASGESGDSGGGFIMRAGTTPILTGTASWIAASAVENQRVVFTEAWKHLDWIKAVTGLTGGAFADALGDAAGFGGLQYYSTVGYADVNGDSHPDTCGRGTSGIVCALSDEGYFVRQPTWAEEFSDAGGWSQPQFYRTIQFPNVDGDSSGRADVCGRGGAGIYCAVSDGTRFVNFRLWTTAFKDMEWVDEKFYSTIRFPDLNGDKRADVCGRGPTGVICALSTGSSFGPATLWTSQYTGGSWSLPQYYSTIQFPDLDRDGDADICARAAAGIYCGKSNGTSFGGFQLWTPEFSDAAGWTNQSYYSTISFPDLNNDQFADVCGRGYWGVTCALSAGGSSFGTASLWTTWFSNPSGYSSIQYYSTIQFPELNGDGMADICGRGPEGLYCRTSNGTSFATPLSVKTTFSDAGGWSQPQYYETIGFGNVDSDAGTEVCARGLGGVFCE